MRPESEVRLSILKNLSKKSNEDQLKALDELLNNLYNRFSERNWVNHILISMDIKNEGLVNIEFKEDPQGNLFPLIPSGATHYLTPDGEYELQQFNN